MYLEGSHKNGCKFSLTATTAPDGHVTVTTNGAHEPTCGSHPSARRLHFSVRQYVLDLLELGVEPQKIYGLFYDPSTASKCARSRGCGGLGGCEMNVHPQVRACRKSR